MGFERLETRLEGPILVAPDVHGDERGFLLESYRESALAELGVDARFVQENHSRSQEGVVRGLHFQIGAGQAKLVRCVRGAIFDVVVDLRRGSPAYGGWEGFQLDDAEHRMLFVPVGFAHGFCVVSGPADVLYRCSSYYDPAVERGIAWDDPDVGIVWPELETTVSDRDAGAPRLREVESELPFRYP
jgi:dTDP-4-dehydrorhamnose 3,5-epimerase